MLETECTIIETEFISIQAACIEEMLLMEGTYSE